MILLKDRKTEAFWSSHQVCVGQRMGKPLWKAWFSCINRTCLWWGNYFNEETTSPPLHIIYRNILKEHQLLMPYKSISNSPSCLCADPFWEIQMFYIYTTQWWVILVLIGLSNCKVKSKGSLRTQKPVGSILKFSSIITIYFILFPHFFSADTNSNYKILLIVLLLCMVELKSNPQQLEAATEAFRQVNTKHFFLP